MSKFKTVDLNIGDYVYYEDYDGSYRVTQITRIYEDERNYDNSEIWGNWSMGGVLKRPKTIEEFNAIVTNIDQSYANIDDIEGILHLTKGKTVVFPAKLSNLENYTSNTIMSLNEMLGKDYDLDDFLKVLIPAMTKIVELDSGGM